MAKPTHGYERTRKVCARFSDREHRKLVERALRSGAATPSAYIRATALTGMEFELPAFATLRDMRNEVIKLAANIQGAPAGPAKDRALVAAEDALLRITRF